MQVTRFCTLPINGSLASQTEQQCEQCAAGLQKIEMTCHILHNPVMQLPIYNCDGCNPAAVSGFCSTVGSGRAPVTHDMCWRTRSADTKQCSFGLPLEESHLVRAFSMFDAGSRFVRQFGRTPWPEASQQFQREFWFGRIEAEVIQYPTAVHRVVWAMYSSENIDSSIQVSVYLAIDALCQHPEYANRTLPNGKSMSEELVAWEAWAYAWLRARSVAGLFVELGADYWDRTWPNILNLVDLPSSARVRARARMFADIAMLEAEQVEVGGLRAGQKSRAKNDGLQATMYPTMMPDLYGESMDENPNNEWIPGTRGGMVESIASTVVAPNVSILVHALGKSPDTGGRYLMRNRIIGQINATQTVPCGDARCAGTLRPPGCVCAKGTDAGGTGAYLMEPVSDQVHTVWRTPSYVSFGASK